MADVQYTKSGDVNIAYQVTGDGPFDLVFVPGFVSHLELAWRMPTFAPFLELMSTYCRLIRFDKRGTGMSDRVSDAPSLETRMDDVRAVMDAAGSTRAAFYGLSEGAAMAILFAATYPERTAALVVRSAIPRRMWAPDYPWGSTEEQFRREVERDLRIFGSREEAEKAVGELGQFDGDELSSFVDYLRYGASPGAVEALHRMNREIDVRAVLPSVHVPTLIMRGSEDTVVAPEVAAVHGLADTDRSRGRDPGSGPPRVREVHASRSRPRSSTSSRMSGGQEAGKKPSRSACSRRCSSRTSSGRPRRRQSWATAPGASSSSNTTR